MKIVTVAIDSKGNSSIDLEGFHGQGCSKVMADFAAGDKLIRGEEKREYYETGVAEHDVVQQ